MNFSFDGKYKPVRNISLGGVKKVDDKKSLLAKAQSERKARELERKKLKSAQHIQAFYRGRRETHFIRQTKRKEFQQLLTNDSNDMFTLTRQLILFYQPTVESDKGLVELYVQNLLSENQRKLLDLFQLKDRELLDSWIWLSCLLIKRVLLPSMEASLSTSCTLLEVLFDPTTYPKGKEDESRIRLLTYALYQTNLLKTIKHTLFMPDPTLNQTSTQLLTRLIQFNPPYYYTTSYLIERVQKRPRTLYVTRDYLLRQLILELWTEPFLLDQIGKTVEGWVVELPLKAVLETVLNFFLGPNPVSLDNQQIAGLLINLTELGDVENGKHLDDALTSYAKTIQILLTRLPTYYLVDPNEQENAENVDTDSDSSDDEENSNQDIVMKEPTPYVSPLIYERLNQLYSSDRVNRLLHQYTQLVTQKDSTDAIQYIASFFNTIMLRWPAKKDSMFYTLLYRSQQPKALLNTLWKFWSNSPEAKLFGNQTMLHLNEAVQCFTQPSVGKYQVENWSTLYLLCEIYARWLLTIADDEFLNRATNPLSLSQVIELSQQLKGISFVMFWRANSIPLTQSIGFTGIQFIQLRSVVTHLLQQIHMRDSRRHFCPADHWLIPDLKTDNFSTEAVAEEFNLENEQPEKTQNRMVSKNRLAVISPRLGLLNNIPFVIPFEQRVEIFRMFVQNDKKRNRPDDFFFGRSEKIAVTVRRDHMFRDGFDALHALGSELKNKVSISFVDEFGLEEAGIDGGGVFKEFLTGLSKEAFDTNYGLFTATSEQLLYPNPSSYATKAEQLEHFKFLGLIIGKGVYEGILLDVAFAEFFLKKCLGRVNYLDDLSSLDPDLYKGLLVVKNFEGNVEDLSLDFTSTHMENGESVTVDLVPGGSHIPVTNQNRIQYIYSIANYRLNVQIAKQCRAFFKGLSTIIDIKWLRMFNQQELQVMLGGASVPIDLEDLRRHTVLAGYMDHDPTVKNFWKVLESFDNELRMKFVKFVTSCSRPPLLGFKELVPQFCLRNAGVDDERLPTSSTCVNLLKLPNYSTYDILRDKLLYAITADAGFDLS